jgi:sporulation protein YlmC with PRC-barrel domain
MEPPASKEGFKVQKQMKITWRKVWAVGDIVMRFCIVVAVCGWALS